MGTPMTLYEDRAGDRSRHVVIAAGSQSESHNHPTTVMMADGKTILCVWTRGHGGYCGPMAKSIDGGLTWESVPTPADWRQAKNCPSIYRLSDEKGKERIIVFAGRPGMAQMISEDEGETWLPRRSLGIDCTMAFTSIARVRDGRHLGMFHSRKGPERLVWRAFSRDGGVNWGEPKIACAIIGKKPCEPEIISLRDGSETLCCVMRENTRSRYSLLSFSKDNGETWSQPVDTHPSLTGDRHKHVYREGGELVVVFRDAEPNSPFRGHFVAWMGESLLQNPRAKIRLLHTHENPKARSLKQKLDCGYAGLELLASGELLATTYGHYNKGDVGTSIVAIRI